MQVNAGSWVRRSVGIALIAAILVPTSSSNRAFGVDASDVLTDDIVTRVLGLEKNELKIPDVKSGDKASAAAADQMKKLREALAEAVSAFRAGNGDTALSKLEEAKKLDASLPPAEVFMARLCFAVNDQNMLNLGRNFLNRAADKFPAAPESYMMLGNLAMVEGRLTDAYVLYEKAREMISATPTGVWTEAKRNAYLKQICGGRVSVCEQRNNWDQGLAEIEAWILMDPKDPVALFRKARLIFLKDPKDDKRTAEARKLFEEAYRNAAAALEDKDQLPAVPPAGLALLELRTANGDIDKAREEITQLDAARAEIEANKREGSRVYSTISQWYLGQDEFKKAEDYAAKATELDKDSPALKQLTAVLHYFAGDPQAETEFTRMNQDQPDDFFASNYLALALSDAKDEEGKPNDVKRAKAVRIAEMNARLNPRSPVAVSTLGWTYFNAGRIADAAQLFGALEQQQNMQVSPDTAYYMAKTFAALPSAQYPNALNRAKSLLELAVKTTGTFRYRSDAEKWLTALGGTVPPRSGAEKQPTTVKATKVDAEKQPDKADKAPEKKPAEGDNK